MNILRDIPGFSGLYGVTADGRVWSYRKQHWLKFDVTRGYFRAALCRDGAMKKVKVHRLVALAWVPNPDDKPELNHIDGDKRNNAASNIEWCTRSENAKHAVQIGLRVMPHQRRASI